MNLIGLLASSGGETSFWNPTIVGVLVLISGVTMFCGSVYLLVATNTGGKLGFLIAVSAITGLMTLLSLLWWTTSTPLNSPRGRTAEWKTIEVLKSPSESDIDAVASIESDGSKNTVEDLAEFQPPADAALINPDEVELEEGVEPSEFARYADATEFLLSVENPGFQTGGGFELDLNAIPPKLGIHEPKYAAIEFCQTVTQDLAPGETLGDQECEDGTTEFLIMERDLGSLRLPPVSYFFASLIMFGVCIFGLNWYEKDRREAAQGSEDEKVSA